MCAVMDGKDATSQASLSKNRLNSLKIVSISFFIVALCFWVVVSVLESFWPNYIGHFKHFAFSAFFIFTTAMMLTGTIMINFTMRSRFDS